MVRRPFSKSILEYSWMLVPLIVIAIGLRIYNIENSSYWIDEIIMARVAQDDLGVIVQHHFLETGRPPLYVFFGFVWVRIFGTSEAATRSLSLLFGIVAIPVISIIGNKLFGKKVAFISALLMTISAYQVFHSQNFRYYSLLQLVTLLAAFFYIQACESNKRRYLVLYTFFCAIIVYTHQLGSLVFIGWGLHFLLYWKKYKRLRSYWLLSQIILLVIVASIYPLTKTLGQLTITNSITIHTPGLRKLYLIPIELLFKTRNYFDWDARIIGSVILLCGLAVFIFITGKDQWLSSIRELGNKTRKFVRKSEIEHITFVVLWFLTPILVLFTLPFFLKLSFESRYLIIAAPAQYLLIGLIVVALRKVVPIVLSLVVIVTVLGIGLHAYYTQDKREDWRGTAAYIDERDTPNDAIAITKIGIENSTNAFCWYHSCEAIQCFADMELDNETLLQSLAHCAPSNSQTMWLIDYTTTEARLDSLATYIEQHPETGFELLTIQAFYKLTAFQLKLPE